MDDKTAAGGASTRALSKDPSTYQSRVYDWSERAFGMERALEPLNRLRRMVEEATELAQAGGLPFQDVSKIITAVYCRPPGETWKEAGAAALTLNSACSAMGIDLLFAQEAELERVYGLIDKIRKKDEAMRAEGLVVWPVGNMAKDER